MLKITMIDYGVGNLHSLRKALEISGAEVRVVTDAKELLGAECLAFPGVGAFDRTMENLLPYRNDIVKRLEEGTPSIGICIGMQIMMESSCEGQRPGFGFFKGKAEMLKAERIPQMGWNTVVTNDPLMDGIDDRFFYFTHSYYCNATEKDCIVGTTEYESVIYPMFFRKKNFVGTQFHPEKSSASGLRFLKNFVSSAEECL